MKIGELCTREVVYVGRNESAAEAARLMREHHVGSLVVLDPPEPGGRAVGMVTDRDITVGIVAMDQEAGRTPVEAVMRPGLAAVAEDDDMRRALALMRAHGVRRLPVVDAHGRLIGLIAADDLLDVLAEGLVELSAVLAHEVRREREERKPVPSPA